MYVLNHLKQYLKLCHFLKEKEEEEVEEKRKGEREEGRKEQQELSFWSYSTEVSFTCDGNFLEWDLLLHILAVCLYRHIPD
jgi:hypothetical protein